MQINFIIFLTISSISSVTAIYRVRKLVESQTVRRSPTDDALDMAAAELIFKEKGLGGLEGPPGQKTLPFGTEHAQTGAPATEPTAAELRDTNLEDLKSSMVGSVGSGDGQETTTSTTQKNHIHDGQTFSTVSTWQKPLENRGRQIAYDFHINPEYPQFAPRARGLVGIPDGWNLDKTVDEEFRAGFRRVDFRTRRRLH